MERIKLRDYQRRVSWGSIIGGVVTVLAISVFLAILSASIGLFKLDPSSANPGQGIGTAFGIITVISLILSFAAGGFVAGKLAGADGMIHGFLVWATTMIVAIILTGSLVGSVVRGAGNLLGSVASVTGNVISGVGSAAGTGVSMLANQAENVFGDLDFDTDRDQINSEVRQILRGTGVRELQPEYIERQMRGVRDDLQRAVRRVLANPQNADQIIDRFTTRLQTRANSITNSVDRDAVVRSLTVNSNLSRAQAESTVDQYIEIINDASDRISDLQANIQEARDNWEQTKQDALVMADEAASAAGRGALWAFFGLLVAGAICVVAGHFGVKTTLDGYEA